MAQCWSSSGLNNTKCHSIHFLEVQAIMVAPLWGHDINRGYSTVAQFYAEVKIAFRLCWTTKGRTYDVTSQKTAGFRACILWFGKIVTMGGASGRTETWGRGSWKSWRWALIAEVRQRLLFYFVNMSLNDQIIFMSMQGVTLIISSQWGCFTKGIEHIHSQRELFLILVNDVEQSENVICKEYSNMH